MNISQAHQIYCMLKSLPEDSVFWDKHYTKEMCFDGDLSPEEWYTREKQYHWGKHWRRDAIEEALRDWDD